MLLGFSLIFAWTSPAYAAEISAVQQNKQIKQIQQFERGRELSTTSPFSPTSRLAEIPQLAGVPAERCQLLAVDLPGLRAAFADGPGRLLELDLFPDLSFSVELVREHQAPEGGMVWQGSVVGEQDSYVVFSLLDDFLVGSLYSRGGSVELQAAGPGLVHAVQPKAEVGGSDTCAVSPSLSTSHGFGPAWRALAPTIATSNGPSRGSANDIDLLVVYTDDAVASVGGTLVIEAMIYAMTATSNLLLNSSSVLIEFNVVHTERMNGYTESWSFQTMLDDLTGRVDGKLDQVHGLRDYYGADLVSMLVDDNILTCGLAWLMGPNDVGSAFADKAFSVVNLHCAYQTGKWSFLHEVSHNLGSDHDRPNAGSPAYSFSYGFETSDQLFHTIMGKGFGTRVPLFSSPTNIYDSGSMVYTMGSATEDNVRSLNAVAPVAAAFKSPWVPAFDLLDPNLHAGLLGVISAINCTPQASVLYAYSLSGGGPFSHKLGPVLLTPPITILGSAVANGSGQANLFFQVPQGAAGVSFWLQAYDTVKKGFSNGVMDVIN